jgi:hypothetical protein
MSTSNAAGAASHLRIATLMRGVADLIPVLEEEFESFRQVAQWKRLIRRDMSKREAVF